MKQIKQLNIDFIKNKGRSASLKRLIAISLIIAVVVLFPLHILRYYQSVQLSKLLNQYNTVKTESILLEKISLPNDNLLFTNNKLFRPVGEHEFKIEGLMAVFNGAKCNAPTLWATLKYDGATINGDADNRMDFSRSISVDLTSEGRTRFFFPAISQNSAWRAGGVEYLDRASYFSGIIVSEKQAPCLEGLYRVKDLSQLSMLLTLQLPFDSDFSYARLQGWENNTNYTVPEKMNTSSIDRILSQPMAPIKATDVEYKDQILSIVDDEKNKSPSFWEVNGYAKENVRPRSINPQNSILAETSYKTMNGCCADGDLLITKQKWHLKESAFVARGTLYIGGVAFVILNQNRPSGLVIVTKPGKFNVIIEVPQDGFYSVGLMNYVKTYNSRENRMIAKVGWVEK